MALLDFDEIFHTYAFTIEIYFETKTPGDLTSISFLQAESEFRIIHYDYIYV